MGYGRLIVFLVVSNCYELSVVCFALISFALLCRYHKLRVLLGGSRKWWSKESRPPPEDMFFAYKDIPEESLQQLIAYHKSTVVSSMRSCYR